MRRACGLLGELQELLKKTGDAVGVAAFYPDVPFSQIAAESRQIESRSMAAYSEARKERERANMEIARFTKLN
jgi:hypothetical protein